MTRQRYIITGATSFLGVALCKEILRYGGTVTAVCRQGSKGEKNLPAGVAIVYAGMDDYASLPQKTGSADVFINLAWQGTAKAQREDPELQKVNVSNSLVAVRAAKALGCSVFVESGSQAEYGDIKGPISESSPCNPISQYGKAKLELKEKAFELCNEIGLKYIHLRIFSIFGETDHPVSLVMSALDKMIAGEPVEMSLCEHKWNFIYSKDAARQIRLLCEHAIKEEGFGQEVFNIASQDTRILKDFVIEMKDISRSNSELLFGAMGTGHQPSLDPDISKTTAATSFTDFTDFGSVVRKIIRCKKGTDNPATAAIDFFLNRIKNKFIRFCFVGCLNAGFGYGVYCLSIFAGASIWLATLISNILGVLWNFMTTGSLVFENREKKLIFRFIACYIINYFINTGAVYLFGWAGCNDYWAGLLATPVAALCSFFLLKFFVYSK